MTDAQCDYIESLLAQCGYSVQFALSECFGTVSPWVLDSLDVGDASVLIDWLLEEKSR